MRRGLIAWLGLLAAGVLPGAAAAQGTHIVRLEVDVEDEIHRFVPARLTVQPGDTVRFRVASGAPHNVAFDGTGLPPEVRHRLNEAMPNRSGDLSGPVLSRSGMEYRMVVPSLPPGRYTFYSVPHRAYDMRGELIVEK